MKKALLLLLTILTLGFVTAPLSAQNTLTVADGTETNSFVPFYGLYLDEVQHTQVIYPADMLTDMQGSSIIQMDFYMSASSSFSSTITISLGISDDATFSGTSFDETTTLTQVYSGPIVIADNVFTVELEVPFSYTGGNLLFDFTNTGGNWSSTAFYGITETGASLHVYTSSWSGVSQQNFIPKTTFSYGTPSLCNKPTNVTATGITTSGATISWTGSDNATSYNIEYMLGTETDWENALTESSSTTTVDLYDLFGSSLYKVRVQTVCSDGTETNWSSVCSFSTACDAITVLPYSQDFEVEPVDGFVPCWSRYASDPSHIVYLNNGESWYWGSSILDFAYTPNCSTMAILPMFDSSIPLNTLQVEFDARRSNTTGGAFVLGALTDNEDITTFEPIDTIDIATLTWEHFVIFCNGYTGDGQYLAFLVDNAGNGSRVLDNLVINLIPDCPSPVKNSVTATDVDGHNATITWEDNDESHYSWTLFYKKNSEGQDAWLDVTVDETTYQLTDLDPETMYNVYVVTNCYGEIGTDATLTYNFTTDVACPAPTAVTADPVYINEATISWTSSAPAFNVEYGETGFTQGQGIQTTVYENSILLEELTDNTSYTVYVQADCGSGDGTSTTWSSVQFTTLPSCPKPTNLTGINMTTTSVELVWTPGYEETEWEVDYGSEDYNPDSSPEHVQVYEPTFTLEGLTANQTYDAYVRAVCDGDETSAWSARFHFTTPCEATDLPLTENFDSYSTWSSPDCWQKFETSNMSGYAYIQDSETYSGNRSLKIGTDYNSNTHGLLRLPDFNTEDLNGLSDLQVKLMAKKTSGDRPLIVGITPNFASVDDLQIIGSITDLTSTYTEKIVSLQSFSGTTGYIVIGVADGSGYSTFYVDDVTVEVRPNCMYPTNFTATEVGETSVTLAWTEMGTAESWNIQYGPMGFAPGEGDEVTATETPSITIEDLEESTAYDFYVQADCDGLGSQWVGPLSVVTSQYIFGVTGSDTVTTCGLAIYDDGGPNGEYSTYCDYTLVVNPATEGSGISISGTVNTYNGNSYYAGTVTIYAGVGTNGEVLGTYSGNKTVNLAYNGPVTINFTSGYYYTGAGFELIVQCTECFPPTNLAVSDQTIEGATISWEGEADSYALYLSGAMSGYFTTSDNSYTFTELTSSSTYSVQVRAFCGSDSSLLSSAISFNTACDAIDITEETPWIENFESYPGSGEKPFVCWETPVHPNGPFVYCGHAQSCHSGENSAEFKGETNLLVLPIFSNDLSELRLSFWATATPHPTTGSVEVGYITDINDASTFVSLADAGEPGPRGDQEHVAGNGNYMGPFDFNGVSAPEGSRIALRYTNSNSTASWNLDDFTVSIAPDCPSPVKNSVTATYIDGHNATIAFTDIDETHQNWIVYYRETNAADDDPWIPMETDNTSVDLMDLEPMTYYDVYVITDCGSVEDNPDATLTYTFQTTVACPPPADLTVSNIGMTTATATWNSMAESFTVTCGEFTTTISETTALLTDLISGNAYTVSVTANCGVDGSSTASTVNFTTALCEVEDQCTYTLNLTDSWGDGWNGSSLAIKQNGVTVATATITSGSTNTVPVILCDGQSTTLEWNSVGNYDYECSFTLVDPFGETLYASSGTPTSGTVTTFTTYCTPPTCPRPASISVSDIEASSAVVSWVTTGEETAWNLEYKANTETNWTVLSVTTNPYTLEDLAASTEYNVRVQADCENGDVSDYRETSFTTACGVVTFFPYSEGFESGELGCWTQETVTGNNPWTTSSSYHYSGSYSVTMSYTTSTSSRLISPIFDLSNVTNPTLSFYSEMRAYSNLVDTFGLYYRTSATDEWVRFAGFDQANETFTLHDSIALPNPSATYQIAFLGYGVNGWGIYLDDIQIYDNNGTGPVTNPTVTTNPANPIGSTTATLNGTVNNPSGVSVTPMGFEWKAASAADYTSVTVTGNALTYELGDLTPNTNYSYRAFITYNGEPIYGSVMNFTTAQVQEPTATTLPADPIGVTTATLNGTISNPDNVTITVQGFQWKAASESSYTTEIATGTTMSVALDELTPNTDYVYRAFVTTANGQHFGEELTFTTLEEPVEPCDVPTGLASSNITANSFTLTWDANNATSWVVRHRPEGGNWTSVNVSTNSHTLTSLTPDTQYEVEVQADCGGGNTSDWSTTLNVTTQGDGIPTHLLNSIALYPNPAREYVDIRVDGDVNVTNMEVFDVYGKLIWSNNHSSMPTRINVSDLADGMYFVRVTTDAGAVTKTFVKQ